MKGMRKDSVFAASIGDPRIRFKHETLMQDYQELNKETGAMKRKLEIMKQKRLTLMAEVRFLRQRYKQLMQNQTQTNPPGMMRLPECGNLRIGTKLNGRRKKQTEPEAGLRPPIPRFDLNKSTVIIENEATAKASVELDKKQRMNNGYEVSRTLISLPDLNQTEKTCNEDRHNSGNSRVPVFDLNEISREEEEIGEQMAVEEPKNLMLNDEMHNEVKLSVCRNIKKGLDRASKRKVSWQDPVALRV